MDDQCTKMSRVGEGSGNNYAYRMCLSANMNTTTDEDADEMQS